MSEPGRFNIGVACLIRSGPLLVLEVQKPHKWVRTSDELRVGIGCIGGPRPALVWEGEGPGVTPGGVVPVYLGDAEGEADPIDLPALLLARPGFAQDLLG